MALNMIRKFAAASVMMFACSAAVSAQTLVFTAIPDEDETKLVERFRGIADYLSENLDVDVRYIPVKSYAAAVSAFRNNQVQLAWFGGLSGVQARSLVPGSEAIAQGVEDEAFYSHIIAHKVPASTNQKICPRSCVGRPSRLAQRVNLRPSDPRILHPRSFQRSTGRRVFTGWFQW